MTSVLTSEEASEAQSKTSCFVSRLDPRLRLVSAGIFALVTVSLSHLAVLCFALGIGLLLLPFVHMPIWSTLRRMVAMDSFFVFMLAILPFTTAGDVAFTVFGFPGSWQGLEKGFEIALKANAIVLVLLVLVGSMEPTTLGHALAKLRVPAAFVHLLLFTVRYIDVIHDEYRRLRIAMKMRGFRSTQSFHCYRSFGYLIGMLLIRALERSERILQAMKCRGFTGQFPLLDHLKLENRDYGFAVVVGLVCGLLIALEGFHVTGG